MTSTARVTAPTEMPYSWDIDLAEGSGAPGAVYRHEIRPVLTTSATAMNKILSKKRARSA